MKAGPLAHEHVPWFQDVSGFLVFDDVINAIVYSHYVVDVGILLPLELFFRAKAIEFGAFFRRYLYGA